MRSVRNTLVPLGLCAAFLSCDGSLGSDARSARLAAAAATPPPAVWTNRYDNERTGANTRESILTPATVAGGSFGLLFSRPVDGQIYAQPLYVPALSIRGATHDVVFVATMHNTVYAFDADDPNQSNPLWSVSLGASGPMKPGSDVSCSDMFPEVGITSTPVIDLATGTMYVVAKTVNAGSYAQTLHALDIKTGAERAGGAKVITASGFDPKLHLNRAGLLLDRGTIYIAFASHCDDGAYHGWVFAYDAATFQQRGVYNTTSGGAKGGIWQSGTGLSTDGTSIYFVAGNGSFDASGRGAQLGLSVGKLQLGSNGLSVVDWWTPTNAKSLNDGDLDLTNGATLIPGSRFMAAGGKDGNIYVIDRTNMGHFNPAGDRIAQTIKVGGHVHGGPVAWKGPSGTRIYIWPEDQALQAYSALDSGFDPTPVARSVISSPSHPGGMTTLSANGDHDGIIWASYGTGGDAWHSIATGALVAFDANDLHVLWSSDANRARDGVGAFAKFVPPVVANGRLYMATFSNVLRVYGLGAPATTPGVYLSDLPWTSATSGWGPIERDGSNGEQPSGDGRALAIRGVGYAKGLGMHGNGEVRFSLSGLYSTFTSDVGIDDETQQRGSVIFQVWVDGAKAWDSDVVRGGEAARHVTVGVAGAKELRLVVLDGGDGNAFDHADWAGAQLVKTVFLSDLSWTSSVNGWGPVERDWSNSEQEAYDGHPLTINGVTYAKGLGMHASSDVRFALGGRYTTFASDVGIDDETQQRGSVVFQVWADGTKAWDSGVVRGGEAARHVNLSVAGVRELRLVVTDAGDGLTLDHADWADATLTP